MAGTREDNQTTAAAPRRAHQPSGRRLLWGLLLSLPVNLAVWGLAAKFFHSPQAAARPRTAAPFLVQRIVLAPPPPAAVKPPPRRIAQTLPRPMSALPKPTRLVRPRTVSRRVPAPLSPPPKQKPPRLAALPKTPPQTASPRLITTPGATRAADSVPPEGNAPSGTTPEAPTETDPQTAASTPPAETTPSLHPAASAGPQAVPAHEDAPPTPAGPTQQAQPLTKVLPVIPDELRDDDYQSSVWVTVQIDAQGNVTKVTLHGSSGNREIDRRAQDSLKRWRWQPALQDGKPVADTRLFHFIFQVR